jgi:hypothetical protein
MTQTQQQYLDNLLQQLAWAEEGGDIGDVEILQKQIRIWCETHKD